MIVGDAILCYILYIKGVANPMLITHEREKLIDVIIFFSKRTKYCGLTKLFKLLYFLDFIHFRETGRSVTGLDYYAWEKGPVPRDLFFEIKKSCKNDLKKSVFISEPSEDESKRLTTIKSRREFDERFFNKREKRILEELADIFREAKSDDMVEVTHLKDLPWDKTKKDKGMNAKIDYLLSLDNSSKRQLSIEEIKIRMEEMSETWRTLK